ncbi:hypothetical protein [Pseudomonas donghuensis]|uniref:hypothetical protein n=1 Tax=Pseudomonas donghuensis TaxID=1163398 RepID=UPI00215FE5BC|nr:hypothetical protein [Pseudomonas donghuensis]UVL22763.1 hypothetical protein LOY30_18165 [Pseudomonas donghuensis]
MPITMTEKQATIQQLLAAKTKSYVAELTLRMKDYPDEADEVQEHGKELSRQIDRLIGEAMSDWMGDADAIISYVKLTNQRMQRSINEINNDIKITENAVKLIGFIDDLVKVAIAII